MVVDAVDYLLEQSLPSRERGLKFLLRFAAARVATSLPSRERGFKLKRNLTPAPAHASLPSRERGLKC